MDVRALPSRMILRALPKMVRPVKVGDFRYRNMDFLGVVYGLPAWVLGWRRENHILIYEHAHTSTQSHQHTKHHPQEIPQAGFIHTKRSIDWEFRTFLNSWISQRETWFHKWSKCLSEIILFKVLFNKHRKAKECLQENSVWVSLILFISAISNSKDLNYYSGIALPTHLPSVTFLGHRGIFAYAE